MKKISTILFVAISLISAQAQSWIPKGEEKLFDGFAVFSMSLVGDSVIWMTTSSYQVVNAQNPVPLTHLIRVMRSVDAGETWQLLSIPESIGRISFDIVGISRDTAFITTQDYESGRGRALMKTVDGGDTWQQKFLHHAAGVYLRVFDHQHLFCQSNNYTATSNDGGDTWSLDTLTLYESGEYNLVVSGANMASVIGDTVWVGTSEGRVFRSTNFGTSHSITQAAPVGNIIQCITFESHLRGMLIYYYDNFTKYGLMRTFDGGTTWEDTPSKPLGTLSSNLTHVKGAPGSYIITPDPYSNSKNFYYTQDFGASWTYGGVVTGVGFNAVQFVSPETGWLSAGYFDPEELRHVGYKYADDLFTSVLYAPSSGLAMEIFPNPTHDMLHYSFPDLEEVEHQVSILHADGRIIFSKQSASNELDISTLPDGMYFLHISAGKESGLQGFVKTSE